MNNILPYCLLLFAITCLGGSIPLWKKDQDERLMKYLLAFSGSFLLGITLLHLIPENIEVLGHHAGWLILSGFFLQQIIQRFTHGMEHGHLHTHEHRALPVLPVFAGLGFHAFSEGIPLGTTYSDHNTLPSLYLAVALHKLPEAMLITSAVLFSTKSKSKASLSMMLFATITPVASLLSYYIGNRFDVVADVITYCIPVVAGSFLHIATTIFFESGTKSHEMNPKKWMAILLGVGLAMLTLINAHPH